MQLTPHKEAISTLLREVLENSPAPDYQSQAILDRSKITMSDWPLCPGSKLIPAAASASISAEAHQSPRSHAGPPCMQLWLARLHWVL